MTRLTIRVDFAAGASIGPGKVKLLEEVERTGSIRRAAEAVGMSFRQGWLLLKAIEDMFDQPVVVTLRGGAGGGGSALTPFGRVVVESYRELERKAAAAAEREIAKLAGHAVMARPHRQLSRKTLRTKKKK